MTTEPEPETTTTIETNTTTEPAPESTTSIEPNTTTEPEPEPTTSIQPNMTTEPEPEKTTTIEPNTTTEPEPETTTSIEPNTTTEPEPKTTTSIEPNMTTEPEPETTTSIEPLTTTEPKPETTTSIEPHTTTEPEPETTTTIEPNTTTEPEPETTTTIEPNTTTEPEPETTTPIQPNTTTEPELETTTSVELNTTTEPEPETTTQIQVNMTTEPYSNITTKPLPEATTQPELETTTKPQTEMTTAPKIETTTTMTLTTPETHGSKYVVRDNEEVCIVLQGSITFDIPYQKKDGSTGIASVSVPDSVNVNGNCSYSATAQEITLTFFKSQWMLDIVIAKECKSVLQNTSIFKALSETSDYSWQAVTLTYVVDSNFPNAKNQGTKIKVAADGTFGKFKANTDGSYKCNAKQDLEFGKDKKMKMNLSKMQYRAFGQTNSTDFSGTDISVCRGDNYPTKDATRLHLLAIALGSAFGGMVVIIAAIFVARYLKKEGEIY